MDAEELYNKLVDDVVGYLGINELSDEADEVLADACRDIVEGKRDLAPSLRPLVATDATLDRIEQALGVLASQSFGIEARAEVNAVLDTVKGWRTQRLQRTLAENIIQRAGLLARLDPEDLDGLTLTDLDYQIEDVTTALARKGKVSNEGLFEPGED